MGIRASLSFRYIAPTTRTAKSSILTPKIAKIPFAETGWLETAPSATQSGQLRPCRDGWDFPRGWRGFAGVGVTRDALEGLNWASFSVFVSNRDFRVPRLRQRGERAADRAVQRRKRGRGKLDNTPVAA